MSLNAAFAIVFKLHVSLNIILWFSCYTRQKRHVSVTCSLCLWRSCYLSKIIPVCFRFILGVYLTPNVSPVAILIFATLSSPAGLWQLVKLNQKEPLFPPICLCCYFGANCPNQLSFKCKWPLAVLGGRFFFPSIIALIRCHSSSWGVTAQRVCFISYLEL